MSEDYILKKDFKCRDCRKRYRSKSRRRQCPECGSENIKRLSSGAWCECVMGLITLPIAIFFLIAAVI